MQYKLYYITAPSKSKAINIAKKLLEAKLVACVNVFPGVESLYVWNGEIHQNSEFVLIAKTISDTEEQIFKLVQEIHDYECPCIISLKIESGEKKFLKWLETSVNNAISNNL